jgi:hypothetical protein
VTLGSPTLGGGVLLVHPRVLTADAGGDQRGRAQIRTSDPILRFVAVRRDVTVAPTRPDEPIGRFTQRR